MADKRDISTKIVIDGEREYKASCDNINAALKTLRSETALVTAEYGKNTDSIDGLTAKQAIQQKEYAEYEKAIEAAEKALEKFRTAGLDSSDASFQKMERNLNYNKVALLNKKQALEETEAALAKASDTSENYIKTVGEIDKSLSVLQAELKTVETAYKGNSNSTELLGQKSEVLTKIQDEQAKKVKELTAAYEKSANESGEMSDGTVKLKLDLENAKQAAASTENQFKDVEKTLAKATETTEETGNEVKNLGRAEDEAREKTSVFGDVLKATLSAEAIKAGISAIVDGIKNIANAAENSVQQFGELEQNLGGSEAVFQEYADNMQKVGEDAYKNMGTTQSQYLATANKMGALFQGSGLEVQKSAELTEKAMQRAADMASVMGIDTKVALDSVAGAAKGNFAMMDNLGVAMNATTIEAYALSKGLDFTWQTATQAEKAEVAMQMFFENTEKYAGNFARESTQTISGSIGMLQAAVGSFTAGLGNANADMTNLTQNVVDAFKTAADNIIPVLGNIAGSLPEVVETALSGIDDIAPELIDAAVGVVYKMTEAVARSLPMVADMGVQILQHLADGLAENEQPIADGAEKIISQLCESILTLLPSIAGTGINVAVSLIKGIADTAPELIPQAVDAVMTFADTIVENIDEAVDAGIELVTGLADGVVDAIPVLLEKAPVIIEKLVNSIVEAVPKLLKASFEINKKLSEGIIDNLPTIGYAAGKIIYTLVKGAADLIENVWQVGEDIVTNIWNGMSGKGEWLSEKSKGFLEEFGRGLQGFPSGKTTGNEYAEGLLYGVEEGIAKSGGGFGRIDGEMIQRDRSDPTKAIREAFEKSKQWMEEYQKSAHYNAEEELARWTMLARKYADYSEGKLEIDNNMARVRQKISDEEARAEEKRLREEETNLKETEKSKKAFYDNEILKIKDYRNQADYHIEGEIAMYEALAAKCDEMSKERIDSETKVRELRKKMADQQANDTKSALKSEEDAIKAREKAEKESLQEIEKDKKAFYEEQKLLINDYKNSAEYTLAGELAMQEEFKKNYSELSKERIEIDKDIAELQKKIAAENKKVYDEMVKDVVSGLKVQYEQASEIEQYHLDRQKQAVREATEEKIAEYRREYDEKIKLIDEASRAEIKALQDKLDALNEEDKPDKSYENSKKLIELNQAITKAQMGDGDLAKAQEAYNKEVKRQQDERIADARKAEKAILEAQIKGVEDATAAKKTLLADQNKAMEEAYAEQEKYFAHIADLEIQIASTKNEELKKLLQDELDEYKRVNEEKVKSSFDTQISGLYDEKINELKSKLSASTSETEKARLQKQLDELEGFKDEYFDNVTLLQEKLNNLAVEAEKEASLSKQKALVKQHYAEINSEENLQSAARLLIVQGNEDEVISLLSKYNDDWKKQGKDYPANMQSGMEKGFADLTAYVTGAMKTLNAEVLKTNISIETGISGALKTDLSESEKYIPKYQSLGENLSGAFKAGVIPIQKTVSDMTDGVTDTISAGAAKAETIIRTKNDELVEMFEEYKPKWYEAGEALADNLAEGANFQKLINKVKAAIEEINAAIHGQEESNVDAFGKTDAELEKERRDKIYSQISGASKKKADSETENSDSQGTKIEVTQNFYTPQEDYSKQQKEAAKELELVVRSI